METRIENQLENFKRIEVLCTQNQLLWEACPRFRGAFTRFALRVSQLDLLAEGEQFIQRLGTFSQDQINMLVREINLILKEHFDRYFAYLKQRNIPIYEPYLALRQQHFA